MAVFHPYLNFNGNTEEAFNFYKSIIGGEFLGIMRFKDIPESYQSSPDDKEKIMHISLPLNNGVVLMGTDVTSNMPPVSFGSNFSICISPDSEEEAYTMFDGLSAGGTITVPLQKMFWGDTFGQLQDKFGVNWMVNYGANNNRKDQ